MKAVTEIRSSSELSVQRWTRAWAAYVLGNFGAGAAAGVPALIAALDDADPVVRKEAARNLGRIGSAASAALPRLRRLARDEPVDSVRGHAAEAVA